MTLRSKMIHLAHENPGLRPILLPLLKEAKELVSKKAEFSGTLQERINEAVRSTGFISSDDLVPHLRGIGDVEAADFVQAKLDANLKLLMSPAYRALNNVRNDIQWSAKGLYIREPVVVKYDLAGGDLLHVFFSERLPKPIAILSVSDAGEISIQETDSVQIGKLLDIQKSKVPNPKVDGLLAYLRKLGASF
jgi:hypothetical protein